MKKPVVDYRQFRLSKINDPQFSHLKLLLGWVGYFSLYFLTENLIPVEKCYPVKIWLDDVVPFCEYFVIPYVLWYVLIVFSLLYFGLYNTDNFRNLQKFIIITQVVAMVIYILFPNRQDLRPDVFPRENFCTWLLGIIYQADTNTGVCPSLHVAYSVGIASAWLKEKSASIPWKSFVCFLVFMICISVAFVKQHSVADIFAAIPVCLLAEGLVFGKYWLAKLKKNPIGGTQCTTNF
ncbi:MAG: phosphatidic acid phosphatase [Lachnospiraceae bacterium]|nr:phosphatidic acid phosphatase [Lachnospiraceae bacterium]